LKGIIQGFHVKEEDMKGFLETLQGELWDKLLERLQEETTDASVVTKLSKEFDKHFRYGSDGLPRIWKPGDEIESTYKEARQEVEF
jgi:hypothetical protein